MKNLYVDDIRELPSLYQIEQWDVARTYDDAISLLSTNTYNLVSLDHDIASYDNDGNEQTGYTIAKWIVQRKFDNLPIPNKVISHSANPVGYNNIMQLVNKYL